MLGGPFLSHQVLVSLFDQKSHANRSLSCYISAHMLPIADDHTLLRLIPMPRCVGLNLPAHDSCCCTSVCQVHVSRPLLLRLFPFLLQRGSFIQDILSKFPLVFVSLRPQVVPHQGTVPMCASLSMLRTNHDYVLLLPKCANNQLTISR